MRPPGFILALFFWVCCTLSVSVLVDSITQPHYQPQLISEDHGATSAAAYQLRLLNDCSLTDVLLVSDINGNLQGVHRYTGALLWTLPLNESLVKVLTNISNIDPSQADILWLVEPSGDGALYYFTPRYGLNKLPATIKELVMKSPFSLAGDDKIYTGTRKTSLYSINIRLGKIQSSFGLDEKCPAPNTHYKLDSTINGDRDSILVGKTTYELAIFSKTVNQVVWNVTFSQWGPNNFDDDLVLQHTQSADNFAFSPIYDKSLLAIDKSLGTPVWLSKIPSLAVSCFDVFYDRKLSEFMMLPHPHNALKSEAPRSDFNTQPFRKQDHVFINRTEVSEEWFALSFENYPAYINSAPTLKYELDLMLWQAGDHRDESYLESFHLNTNTDSAVADLLLGTHSVNLLSRVSSYRPESRFTGAPEVRGIGDGIATHEVDNLPATPEHFLGGWRPQQRTWNLESGLATVVGGVSVETKLPDSPLDIHVDKFPESLLSKGLIGRRIIEDVVILSLILLLVLLFGDPVRYIIAIRQKVALQWQEQLQSYPEELTVSLDASEVSATDIRMVSEKIMSEDVPSPLEGPQLMEPINEILKDTAEFEVSIESTEAKLSSDETLVGDVTPDVCELDVDGDEEIDRVDPDQTPRRRKRGTRGGGKRGGKKQKPKVAESVSPESGTTPVPLEVSEEVIESAAEIATKSLIPQTIVAAKISHKKLQMENNLVISDKILGYGSHGTVVYQGTFENRPVAVKRMLLDFFDVASHEVRLLQESDDHPHVIRYFCSQLSEKEKFLYIALELCLCSLDDIIEKPQNHASLRMPQLNSALFQLAGGLHYLHSLNIIHRDLKPQNILVASAKEQHKKTDGGDQDEENNVRLLISDFGLCKKLEIDQSSFHATTQYAALGTTGWRAPELLLQHDQDFDSDATTLSDANTPNSPREKRLTRLLDIFSLGCVFFYILTAGQHPFGDRYMRELNIIRGESNLEQLEQKCPHDYIEANDLISKMISSNPHDRPSTKQILRHPFFWPQRKKLEFLLKVSDRFEIERRDPPSPLLLTLETYADKVHGGDWHSRFAGDFLANLGKYRKYQSDRLMDLLRAMRNKYHHYNDMPPDLLAQMSPLPNGFYEYFNLKFPQLLMQIYYCVAATISDEHVFKEYFT